MEEARKRLILYGASPDFVMARGEGRSGLWAIDPDRQNSGNTDDRSPFGCTMFQTLFADKDCSMLPIFRFKGRNSNMGLKIGRH